VHLQVGVVCLEHDLLDFRITGFGLCGCCGIIVIFDLLFISCFAGFLPVFSCVLIDKWLIINAIHFCMLWFVRIRIYRI
jgi:hypothetical protein